MSSSGTETGRAGHSDPTAPEMINRVEGDASPDRSDRTVQPQQQVASAVKWKKMKSLGRGAFGEVFLAMNIATGELMAAKQIHILDPKASNTDPKKASTVVRDVQREINVMARLPAHPNVVRYLGSQEKGRSIYIFMEVVSGGSIESLLRACGEPFHEATIQRYAFMVLQGLHHIHLCNIVHQDIKGANVLIDQTGVAKIADFGCCKDLSAMNLNSSKAAGSPMFMAPEVCRGSPADTRSDIWSLGCLFLEMVRPDRRPWSKFPDDVSVFAIIYQISTATEPPEIPSHLNPQFQDVIRLCLKIEPSERATTDELLQHPFFSDEYRKVMSDHLQVHSSMASPQDSSSILDSTTERRKRQEAENDSLADLQGSSSSRSEKMTENEDEEQQQQEGGTNYTGNTSGTSSYYFYSTTASGGRASTLPSAGATAVGGISATGSANASFVAAAAATGDTAIFQKTLDESVFMPWEKSNQSLRSHEDEETAATGDSITATFVEVADETGGNTTAEEEDEEDEVPDDNDEIDIPEDSDIPMLKEDVEDQDDEQEGYDGMDSDDDFPSVSSITTARTGTTDPFSSEARSRTGSALSARPGSRGRNTPGALKGGGTSYEGEYWARKQVEISRGITGPQSYSSITNRPGKKSKLNERSLVLLNNNQKKRSSSVSSESAPAGLPPGVAVGNAYAISQSNVTHQETKDFGKEVSISARQLGRNITDEQTLLAALAAGASAVGGPSEESKALLVKEKEAATIATQTGIYITYRNENYKGWASKAASAGKSIAEVAGPYGPPEGGIECCRIGPNHKCFCGHTLSQHAAPVVGKKGQLEAPKCFLCKCEGFKYVPNTPEEIGENWLTRRKGFDLALWAPKCKSCGHSTSSHSPGKKGSVAGRYHKCEVKGCPCFKFQSGFACVVCDAFWEDHETVFETREQRIKDKRPVDGQYLPLASVDPAFKTLVFGPDDQEGHNCLPEAPSSMKNSSGVRGAAIQSKPREVKPTPKKQIKPAEKSATNTSTTSTTTTTTGGGSVYPAYGTYKPKMVTPKKRLETPTKSPLTPAESVGGGKSSVTSAISSGSSLSSIPPRSPGSSVGNTTASSVKGAINKPRPAARLASPPVVPPTGAPTVKKRSPTSATQAATTKGGDKQHYCDPSPSGGFSEEDEALHRETVTAGGSSSTDATPTTATKVPTTSFEVQVRQQYVEAEGEDYFPVYVPTTVVKQKEEEEEPSTAAKKKVPLIRPKTTGGTGTTFNTRLAQARMNKTAAGAASQSSAVGGPASTTAKKPSPLNRVAGRPVQTNQTSDRSPPRRRGGGTTTSSSGAATASFSVRAAVEIDPWCNSCARQMKDPSVRCCPQCGTPRWTL